MPEWLIETLRSVFYFGLNQLVVKNARTRMVIKRMAVGFLVYSIAAVLFVVTLIFLLGSLFFFLASQNLYVLPALWCGGLVFMLALLLLVWGASFWRTRQL